MQASETETHPRQSQTAPFASHIASTLTEATRKRLADNSSYHRNVFVQRGKVGLYTNWIQYVTHTDYDEQGRWIPIPGEKAVFMNPHTQQAHIDQFLGRIHG